MKKILTISGLCLILFSVELFLFNYVGAWAMPNLLVLVIIFVNLWLGIRYSLATAVIAGLLKDSFSTEFFGLYIFIFSMCAFTTALFVRYIYQKGSLSSRLLLVACVLFISYLFQVCLHAGVKDLAASFQSIFIYELVLTLLLTEFVFSYLRVCASKFFV